MLKAHDSELNRPIAIKLLAPHLAHVGAARERFAREGRAAAAVVHEHVVAIYNVESGGPVPFLVMQYVPGRSLQARVTEDGPLGVEEILRIGIQAASGLAAAHRQGLVHRDVKPANILLENTVERAILTDFGLARAIDDASLTQTGILAGTPHYMSPEQAIGGPIDHRSDLFSLGAVLYFMATGHPPFRGASALAVLHRICEDDHRPAWQVNKDMPDELSDVIDRLLGEKAGATIRERGGSAGRAGGATCSRAAARLGTAAILRLARQAAAAEAGVGGRYCGRMRCDDGRRELVARAGAANVDRAQPTDTLEQALQLKQLDTEYAHGLGVAIDELNGMPAQSRFLQGSDDVWGRELETVRKTLSELESTSGNIPD